MRSLFYGGVVDNLIKSFRLLTKKEERKIVNIFETYRDKVLSLFENDIWVKWIHDGTKFAYTQKDKEDNIVYASKSRHCAICLNINGCCFPKNNMPRYPLHFNCHCRIEPKKNIIFETECPIEKFADYIFKSQKINSKKELFESWGYDKLDSKWLQEEFCRQALDKYSSGEFTLNKLNEYGQRINIEIELPRKNGSGIVTFQSGWMVYPNGLIKLTTPYGEK